MSLKLSVAPTTEPVSLAEAKIHLRLDSGDLGDNLTSTQTIFSGDHATAAAYSLVGTGVEVRGYIAMVELVSGTNGAGGTVDVKLQESEDDATYTDVTSGAFTQVTTVNDNATYELEYTGVKKYIRAVATVAVATCDFGVNVLTYAPYSTEDALISSLITTARRYCETYQNRAYITQTWALWLDAFPATAYIKIPLSPLISITSIKYYDTSDTEATFGATYYYTDTVSEPGRVCLDYGQEWPTTTLRDYNGVCITFVAGYGTSADVPETVKQAIKLLVGDYFENREAGKASEKTIQAVDRLLMMERCF